MGIGCISWIISSFSYILHWFVVAGIFFFILIKIIWNAFYIMHSWVQKVYLYNIYIFLTQIWFGKCNKWLLKVKKFVPLMLIDWICYTKLELDLFLYIRNNTLEHKFKQWFCTPKPVLNVCFKDFWYTKINPT